MSIKVFYKCLAILLVYGLIIGGFIVFGQSLEERTRVLDIVVVCLVATQWVEFALFPLVNLGKPAHREVGMMGIHFYVINICCVASIALVVFGIIYEIPFMYQLMGQLLILFVLLVGRMTVLHAGEKVQQIYHEEESMMQGKRSLQATIDDFMDDVASLGTLDPAASQRLSSIHESLRYLTPSSSSEALRYEEQFLLSVSELRVLMRNADTDREKIIEEIGHLERILARRKKF